MKIESYSFGEMVIDDRSYHDDLMIAGEEIKSGWYRERGHVLTPEDLSWVLEKDPDQLIVGAGSSGRMRITGEVEDVLNDRGIELKSGVTERAVEMFNEAREEGKGLTAAVFHLTC